MTDTMITGQAARAIATTVLGRNPGPMAAVESLSHQVHVAADIVVKIIAAEEHTRLSREITLAAKLPDGLTAPLLGSGTHLVGGHEVRYACYVRAPGAVPGMGLPDVDEAMACSLAEQAVQRLHALHSWAPRGDAERILREPLDHGGFVSKAALLAEIEGVAAADRDGVVPFSLLAGLTRIAGSAPQHARADVPVHADCHWGNWLAVDGRLTALLDFEWARFGEPMDDWFFVIADSGPHLPAVLDVVARETSTSPDTLRAECEVREANHLASDIRLALSDTRTHARLLTQRLTRLTEVIIDRVWEAGPGGRATR
ncbi:phosphotransferase [Actinoplanes sp. GCM10030250]|uniref:phosphotransferase n=1 Tax=Actinoplanes sp. GCM10030250 TaxID=3273376 RepID=UPI0036113452